MPTPPLTDEQCIEALNLIEEYGSPHYAQQAGKGSKNTIAGRAAQGTFRNLRPTFRKEEKRISQRSRLGKMHIVIPDVQAKAGVRNDHLEWVGNYIAEKQPDTIICIGDFADMPSLSMHDKGKLDFEGRRYNKDIDAARAAMEKLMAPIKAVAGYHPALEFNQGNHEHRADRVAMLNPEFEGRIGAKDLGFEDWGWKVHEFLKVVTIDGIQYSHYFTSGVMGRPVSSAAALLRERQCSATMGHVQHTDIAMHKKTQNIALFCGTCYLHDEKYLGPQDNNQRRQIVVKHEVEDGRYDPMFVSLKFLEKAYS